MLTSNGGKPVKREEEQMLFYIWTKEGHEPVSSRGCRTLPAALRRAFEESKERKAPIEIWRAGDRVATVVAE